MKRVGLAITLKPHHTEEQGEDSSTATRNTRHDDGEMVRKGEDPEGKQHFSSVDYLEDTEGFKGVASKIAAGTSSVFAE